jgi:excisionase family DNA binding protein
MTVKAQSLAFCASALLNGRNQIQFFTIEAIAGCMEVCPRTVRRWIKKGRLVTHRINGVVRISDADFQSFLSAHRDSDASADVHQSPSKSAT